MKSLKETMALLQLADMVAKSICLNMSTGIKLKKMQ